MREGKERDSSLYRFKKKEKKSPHPFWGRRPIFSKGGKRPTGAMGEKKGGKEFRISLVGEGKPFSCREY